MILGSKVKIIVSASSLYPSGRGPNARAEAACSIASFPANDELHVRAQHLLLSWIEAQCNLRDDVVQVGGVREFLPRGADIRDVSALPTGFPASCFRSRRV